MVAAVVALWGAGAAVLLRQATERGDAQLEDAVAVVRTAVEDEAQSLVREATLLARDAGVVEGAVKGDWLARDASPRMLALTVERVADLLVVLDLGGATRLQVPALPRVAIPDLPPPGAPTVAVRVLDGRAWLLGLAPVRWQVDTPVGVVVVGRRLEQLERRLARLPGHPAVVALSGNQLVGATRAGVPAGGWLEAARTGRLQVDGAPWALRPVGRQGALWAAVPAPGPRRALWLGAVAALGLALAAVGATAWIVARPRRATGRLAMRRELEALYAVTHSAARSADVPTAVGELIAVACDVAHVPAGAVFELADDVLTPVAQRGMTAAELSRLRARPVAASHAGEAVRSGRVVITDLRRSPLLDPETLEVARAAGRRLQIALPVLVDGRAWGALVLLSAIRRGPGEEELRLLGAVTKQIGLVVGRASLEAAARQSGRRLDTLTRLGRPLTATLSLDELLQRVADAAVEVSGASQARVWLVDAGGATVSLVADTPTGSAEIGHRRLSAGEGLVGTVITSRTPITVADLGTDPRVRNVERVRGEGSTSWAGVPLLLGEQALGALTIAARERHEYSDAEVALLQSLASHAAAAIDNARRFAEETRSREQLAALLEINKRIAAAESSEALLGSIAEEAARLLEVDNAGFRLVDGDELVIAGLAGTAVQTMLRPRIRIGESFSGRVVREGRTVVAATDEVTDVIAEHREADARLGYRQYLGVPLWAGDRIIGVLAFRARRAFTARDRALAEAFAGQAALALEHARLYRDASRHAERMAALADVEHLLTETLDADVVATRIADALRILVQATSACVYRLAEGGDLVALSVSSPTNEPELWVRRLAAGHGAVGLAVRERRAIVSTDLATDPRIIYADADRVVVHAGGYRAVISMPLVVRDRVIGGISVADREGRVFDEDDVRLVQAFANQAAVALENARLFGEAGRHAARMAALADIERSLSEALDPDVVAQRIVDSVCALLGARSAALYGIDAASGDCAAITVSRDVGATFSWTHQLPAGHGVVGLAVTGREPVVTADVLADPRLTYDDIVRVSVTAATHRALLAVPLLAGDRVLGALAIGDETGRAFDAEEVRVAQAFAGQAAVALENARLFALETARRFQMEVLAAVERELAAELDRERLLRLIVDRVSRLFAGFGTIYLVAGGDRLVRTAWAGEPVGDREIPFGAGISGASAAARRGLVTNDYARSAAPLPAFIEVETTRVMAQPLMAGDRLLGAISMSRRGADALPFSDDDLAVLESFANQTAIALENARLHGEAQRGRDEAQELARVARTLTESLEVSAVGARIVDSVLSLLPGHSAGLRLITADGSLVVIAWRGPEGSGFPVGDVQSAGGGLAGRALAEGRAVWSADVLEDPAVSLPEDLRDRIRHLGHRAVLAVPLSAKGRTIGVLVVTDTVVRAFTDAEVALARAFADQAALALDNARLHEEAERRRREAEVLADLARTINASLDLGRVLQHITDGAHELCASDLARIALREPGGEQFAYRYWVGARYGAYDGFQIQVGLGASGLVIETGRPFRTDDHVGDPRLRRVNSDIVRAESLVTGLVVPIRIDGRVDGLLSVNNRTARRFTDRDEAILVQLADHAAIAIRNARLYESVETRAARLRTLADVNRVVSSSLDSAEVLRAIARAASELMDRAFVAFWVANEAARMLTFSAVADPAVVPDPLIETLAFGEGVVGQAAVERRTIDVADVTVSQQFRAPDWARANGLIGFRAVPIVLQGALLGVLALGVRRPLRFDADEEALLDSFVAQAAVALDHARLYAETRRRLEETRALLEVAEILNSTLDPRQLLKRATIEIARVCGVDRCTLELWDGDRVIPLMSQFADGHRDPAMWEAFVARRCSPRDVPAQMRALETRRPVVIEDATTTDQLPREWIEAFGHKSYMVVPLIRQDQVMGVLTLDYTERITPFQDWQVGRATAVAGQVALALENTRLYAESQERLRETSTLLAVGQALSEPAPVEEGMRRTARELARATGADMAGVCVLDDAGEALRPLTAYHVPAALRDLFEADRVTLERSAFLREAVASGAVTWSADPAADARFSPAWASGLAAHTVLFAPARVRGTTNGGLFLIWSHPGRAIELAEIRLVEGVAAQVGLALDNAALARQREERLRETETLLAVSRALSSTLDLDTLLRQFMRQIAGAVGADTVGVWLLDGEGEWMTPIAGYRVPRVAEARDLRLSVVEHAFYAEAVRLGRPVFAGDTASDPRIPAHLLEAFPHRSQLFAPVRAQERMIGGFMAVWWERPRRFTDRDFALIDAIASQAGVAIQNARLFQQNRRQVDELSVLHELSRAVTGQLDREALLDTIRANVQRVLGAQRIVVLLVDEKNDEFEVALRVMDGGEHAPRRYARSAGLASVVLATGRTLRAEDYAAECARRNIALPPVDPPRHWVGAPMRAGDGMLGVLTVSREDRPFAEAEEHLLGNIADLAALALRSAWLYEERTRAYGELAAAQDHLVRTEKLRALGEMASGVAHDFNNLLAAILGRTQLLLRQVRDAKLRRWLEIVERSALDGAQTVRRLQDFARVRRDQPKVSVDLRDVVRDALEITRSRWHEEALGQGIALEVRRRLDRVPPVAGDPAELREAMTNLILNALDAMPDGGTLTLTTRFAGRRVEIVVQDTGVGIPPEVRDKIFDPFFTTKGPRGTGLGLSMTYGIVARHGGSITVESEPGRGTAFRLSFPPTHAPEAPPAEDVAPETPPVPLRCLVVDDEEAVGAVLGDTIEALGHRAVVVTDGSGAVDLVAAERFDAVFTDLAMPGVSGWQVAGAVKAAAPDVPVFLVTGFGVEVPIEEQKANGVDGIYSKPLRIEDVMNALAQVARARTTHFPEDP